MSIDIGYPDELKSAFIQRQFLTLNRDSYPLGSSHAGYSSVGVIMRESEIRDSMVTTEPSSHRAELQNAVIKRTTALGGILPPSRTLGMVYKWKN